MYEDRTENYDAEIHEEHLIHDTPFSCHIIYSHVQTIAQLQKQLIRLKGNTFLLCLWV